MESTNISLIKGNLFDAPEAYSLAHCVSKDLEMSKGIALEFRNRFGGIDDLKSQSPEIGKTLFLNISNKRFAFYLVTKEKYFQKPTYSNLEKSLVDLCNKCVALNVNFLAMPAIGCGLDKLKWDQVFQMINRVFSSSNIKILIFSLKDTNCLKNMGEKPKLSITKLQLAKVFSLGASFFNEASKALKNKSTKKISHKEPKAPKEKPESPSKPKANKPKLELSPSPGTGLWAYMDERLKTLKREPLHIGTQESVLKKIIVNEWRSLDKTEKDHWNENGLHELEKRNKEDSKTPSKSPAKEAESSKTEEIKPTPLKTPSKEEKKSHHKEDHHSEHKSHKKSEKKRSRSRSRSSSVSEEERSHKKKHRRKIYIDKHRSDSESEAESSDNEKSKKKHKKSK